MRKYRFVIFGCLIVAMMLIAAAICHWDNAEAVSEDLALVMEPVAEVVLYRPEEALSLADYNEYRLAAATFMSAVENEKPQQGFLQGHEKKQKVLIVVKPAELVETDGSVESIEENSIKSAELTPEREATDMVLTWSDEENPKKTVKAEVGEELTLEWVKEHLLDYYTEEEIRQTTLIVMGEDLVAYSNTVWSAHVWVILGRVGASGFAHNDTIIGVLSAPYQFSTYTESNLSKEVDPDVEWVVRDVFARKILEDNGAPEAVVGRTVPKTHLFFDNRDDNPFYNEFYRYCWGDIYDPFDSPYNPYDN